MSFFLSKDRQLYAILNADEREPDGEQVLLALPLGPQDTQTYERLKSEGRSDAQIHEEMFARVAAMKPSDSAQVSIPISELSKSQLLRLLESRLGISLPSLSRMKKDDLARMVLALMRLGSRG